MTLFRARAGKRRHQNRGSHEARHLHRLRRRAAPGGNELHGHRPGLACQRETNARRRDGHRVALWQVLEGLARQGSGASRVIDESAPPLGCDMVSGISYVDVTSERGRIMGELKEEQARWHDRRESARHAITLRVDYKRMNTFFADYAKNISRGGTFIRTTKPLDIGTEFIFVLSIPGQVDHLQLRGEVMWTVDESQTAEDRPAGMGIRFRFAEDSERQDLDSFVGALMAEKLGGLVASKLLGRS